MAIPQMKTLVIYYSYTGHTRKLAAELAGKEGADLYEVLDAKRPGVLKAYTAGCVAALRMKRAAIRPITVELDSYDTIIVMSPIWAGHPAPAINSVLDRLPAGKTVRFRMVSASGGSGCRDKVLTLAREKGCTAEFEDIKG